MKKTLLFLFVTAPTCASAFCMIPNDTGDSQADAHNQIRYENCLENQRQNERRERMEQLEEQNEENERERDADMY